MNSIPGENSKTAEDPVVALAREAGVPVAYLKLLDLVGSGDGKDLDPAALHIASLDEAWKLWGELKETRFRTVAAWFLLQFSSPKDHRTTRKLLDEFGGYEDCLDLLERTERCVALSEQVTKMLAQVADAWSLKEAFSLSEKGSKSHDDALLGLLKLRRPKT